MVGTLEKPLPLRQESAVFCIAGCGRKEVYWNPLNGVVECHHCGRVDVVQTAEVVEHLVNLLRKSRFLLGYLVGKYSALIDVPAQESATDLCEKLEMALPRGETLADWAKA